jgi:hypothetical protein
MKLHKSIIIIIINNSSITVGKTVLLAPQLSLEDSARLQPVFTSLDFTTIIFRTAQGRQPCIQPPTWRAEASITPKISTDFTYYFDSCLAWS